TMRVKGSPVSRPGKAPVPNFPPAGISPQIPPALSARRCQEIAIASESHAVHGITVTGKMMKLLARGSIPNLDHLVLAAGCQSLAVRAENQAMDNGGMP